MPARLAPLTGVRMAFVLNSGRLFRTHFLHIAEFLRNQGTQVTVVCPRDESTESIQADRYRWEEVRLARAGVNPLSELRVSRQLAEIYRRNRLDLVHHITAKAVVHGSIASERLPRLAVVNTISGLGYAFAHPSRARILRFLLQRLYRRAARGPATHLIFENSDDRDLVHRWGVRLSRRSELIPGTGVDCGRFKPAPPPPDPPVFAFVGRLLRDKGVDEFIEAARLLRERGTHVRMAVIGGADPGNPSSLGRGAEAGQLSLRHVEAWGYRDDIAAALAQVHAVVLPSWREGFPRVLQEAAAAGLPVIATDVPGCRHAVEHAVHGLLVPVRDAAALAEAIARLAGDKQLRSRLGSENRRRALLAYRDVDLRERHADVYRRALAHARERKA